jgi:hypothetical protein
MSEFIRAIASVAVMFVVLLTLLCASYAFTELLIAIGGKILMRLKRIRR